MLFFKRTIVFVLIYMLTIPFEFLPYMNIGKLSAANPKVTIINIFVDGKATFSERMTQFIKDELTGKNRLNYYDHEIKVVTTKVKKRSFDSSKVDNRETIKEIKGLVKDKEYAMAIESWQTIIDSYEENFENLENFKYLYVAFLNKAFLENLENMDSEAKVDMKQAISIGRNLTFNVKDYSPRFLIKYERERKRSKKKNGIITVDAQNAKVYIDGMMVGNAPISIANISYGKHYIVLTQNAKVIKKEIVTLTKRKKKKVLKIANTGKKGTSISSLENALTIINQKLASKLFDSELLDALQYFAKNKDLEFIVLGYANKKDSIYNANLFLYNRNMNKLAKLTKAEFDEDLLTGDVEALRIGKETVKGIDNFNSLQDVSIQKNTTNNLVKSVSYAPYKKLTFKGAIDESYIPDPEKEDKVAIVKDVKKDIEKDVEKDIKKDTEKNSDFNLDDVEDVKKDKQIKIDDADYSKLNKKSDINLNKYDDEDEKSSAWYSSWWFWTGVATIAATGAGVYYLTKDDSHKVTATVSW